MAENLNVLNTAVSLLIRAALLAARLLIIWYIEAFQIPRRRVSRYFGIARSTLYRWLHQIEDQGPSGAPANKTPTEIASLVWEITKANLSWGRIRIANQLKLLVIFQAASMGRNILQRAKPRNTRTIPAATTEKTEEMPEARSIPASYPNHVWSSDTRTESASFSRRRRMWLAGRIH
jgi:transposase-like protein